MDRKRRPIRCCNTPAPCRACGASIGDRAPADGAVATRAGVAGHTFGVGSDTRPANVRVADLVAPARVFPGDRFAVSAFLQSQGLAGERVRVELEERPSAGAGESAAVRVLDSVETILGADGDLVPVRFDVPGLAPPGRRLIAVRVVPPAADRSAADDEQAVDVEVVDRVTQVLLMAGNHGDEWEGQIALGELIRELEPEHVRGRLVILPSANFPAASAAQRTSPIDDGNLNRAFPGDTHGTATQQLAWWLEHVLLPGFDLVFDLHSGGSSLTYVPCVLAYRQAEPAAMERLLRLVRAFGAPVSFFSNAASHRGRTLPAAAPVPYTHLTPPTK